MVNVMFGTALSLLFWMGCSGMDYSIEKTYGSSKDGEDLESYIEALEAEELRTDELVEVPQDIRNTLGSEETHSMSIRWNNQNGGSQTITPVWTLHSRALPTDAESGVCG